MKVVGWFVFLPLAVYGALCLYLFVIQRSMLYFPTRESACQEAEPVYLGHGGELLKIWKVEGGGSALLYFGGNAENVAMAARPLKQLFPGYSLYLMNYRGYGGSSGLPSEEALVADAVALYDQVGSGREVVVYGRSLGTGVAMQLASQRPVSGLILVTPFDSMVAVARHHYPFLPIGLLMRDRYDSLARAGMITSPTLVLIAEEDEVIPRRNSDNLVDGLAEDVVSVRVISSAGHNDIELFSPYREAIGQFLAAQRLEGDEDKVVGKEDASGPP